MGRERKGNFPPDEKICSENGQFFINTLMRLEKQSQAISVSLFQVEAFSVFFHQALCSFFLGGHAKVYYWGGDINDIHNN